MTNERDLMQRIVQLEAENLELLARAGELPEMPRNREGLPFSGPRLIIVRWTRAISVDEMAAKLRVSRQNYIGIESETVAPTMEQIENMSMLLHWPLRFFFAEGFRLMNFEGCGWSGPPIIWDADHLHVRKWMA